MSARGEIEIKNLSKIYSLFGGNKLEALSDSSIMIPPGQFLSIIGPSGCGKSTLLRLIAGLETPTTGSITIDRKSITAPQNTTGIVFQRPTLLPWRTVIENVLLPFSIRRQRTIENYNKAVELLDLVGLKEFISRYPSELSGGMQQRVALARALITDPDVLLMDEPFGALDEFTRETMNEELLEIWRKHKVTIIFITHSISESVYLSDRVITMSTRPGQIKSDMKINLPRPRIPAHRSSDELFESTRILRSLLEAHD